MINILWSGIIFLCVSTGVISSLWIIKINSPSLIFSFSICKELFSFVSGLMRSYHKTVVLWQAALTDPFCGVLRHAGAFLSPALMIIHLHGPGSGAPLTCFSKGFVSFLPLLLGSLQ